MLSDSTRAIAIEALEHELLNLENYAAYVGKTERVYAAIAELKAAASEWRPVKSGFQIACEGQSGWKLYASENDIGVVNTNDAVEEHYVYAAPHGLWICQRVIGSQSAGQDGS